MVPCACPGHRVQAPSRSAKALLCHANETLCDAASATQVGPARTGRPRRQELFQLSDACQRSLLPQHLLLDDDLALVNHNLLCLPLQGPAELCYSAPEPP